MTWEEVKHEHNHYQEGLFGWVPEPHVCNPSHLEGRDQEDRGSCTSKFARPYLEKSHHKNRLIE
jgi:hypothetical protein